MNRTERLYALVEELRHRAPRLMPAAAAAARFEVSTRTIERDLLALQEAGVPIWAQPGPGGGYRLNLDATLPSLNFTAEEAAAVATALTATSAMPFAMAGRSALLKLTAAMAPAPLEAATRLVGQIRVLSESGATSSRIAEIIRQALSESVTVELTYRDAKQQETQRTVEPAGLFGTAHGWYLAAWCRLRESPRAFRLDRVTAARLGSEQFDPRPMDAVLRELPFELVEPELM